MKTLFSLLILGAVAWSGPLHASPLNTLQNVRVRAQQTASANNLRQIFTTVADYRGKNDAMPTLEQLKLPNKTLSNPYHALSVDADEVSGKITDANSGYAYFGSVLDNSILANVALDLPLAFEKPGLRPDGKIMVLTTRGRIDTVETKAKKCAEVIKELKEKSKTPDAAVWTRLAARAEEIDKAE